LKAVKGLIYKSLFMLIANLADLVEASFVLFRPKDNTTFAQGINRREESH